MVVVRVGERGRMEIYYLIGTKFQFVMMKKVLEINDGDSCTQYECT